MASLGMNCLRIPFNHRHFMDDRNPDIIKKKGFELLDRVINACAEHGLYTILDLHTVRKLSLLPLKLFARRS